LLYAKFAILLANEISFSLFAKVKLQVLIKIKKYTPKKPMTSKAEKLPPRIGVSKSTCLLTNYTLLLLFFHGANVRHTYTRAGQFNLLGVRFP
jgi:hypothetical protein